MRVSQERALAAIEHRMELAYIMNDQGEYMKPWNATVTTLVACECWHGAIAGIDDAGNGCWRKMDWFVYFVILFLILVAQCLFLQYGDIHISFTAYSNW